MHWSHHPLSSPVTAAPTLPTHHGPLTHIPHGSYTLPHPVAFIYAVHAIPALVLLYPYLCSGSRAFWPLAVPLSHIHPRRALSPMFLRQPHVSRPCHTCWPMSSVPRPLSAPSPTFISPASGHPSPGPHPRLACTTGFVNASRMSPFYTARVLYHPPPALGPESSSSVHVSYVTLWLLSQSMPGHAIHAQLRPPCCTLSTCVLTTPRPSETPCPTRALPCPSHITPALNRRHHICLYPCPCASTHAVCPARTSGLYTTLGTRCSHTIGEYISVQQRHFVAPGYHCPCD